MNTASAIRCGFGVVLLSLLTSCVTMDRISPAERTGLAPTGTLRAAINLGNPILAHRDPTTGELQGVSVDLSRELARRVGVPVHLIPYDAAGKVVEGLASADWDVAFLAIDPARAVDIHYTAPYVVIEGAYLVPQASPIHSNEEVDQQGVRIVVGTGSAYDLFLTRNLKHATIVRAATSPTVTDLLVSGRFEVAAGVRQQLEADALRIPGLRLLDGRFMQINQAMGLPRGRDEASYYLQQFIRRMKSSGFVARALAHHRVAGVEVAP